MNIGFTGSRTGMTSKQKQTFVQLLHHFSRITGELSFHHGDCIGSDEDAHILIHCSFLLRPSITIHPPLNSRFRAYCESPDDIKAPLPYIKRNKTIVESTQFMIATPDASARIPSGTWSTIRYTLKRNKLVYIILPNGDVDLRLPQNKS